MFSSSPSASFPSRKDSTSQENLETNSQRPNANHRREIVATATMTVFLLSQWVLPQSMLLQNAQARPVFKDSEPSGSASTKAPKAEVKTRPISSKVGSKAKSGLDANGIPLDAPAWYKASQARDAKRIAATKQGMKMLLAQNTERRPFTAPQITGGGQIPGVKTNSIKLGGSRAEAASGAPLLRQQFPGDVRASAPLSKMPFITPLRIILDNNRVPSQEEITALGGLAGPLNPTAPAQAEQYAATVDKQLKTEGFDQGISTPLAAADANLTAGTRRLFSAKAAVEKARNENREFARSLQKWNDGNFKGAAQELAAYAKKYPDSPWTQEARIHVANYAKFTNRGNEAEDIYRDVIAKTSSDPNDLSYGTHRKAFGRLTDLYLIEKRYGEVRPMLEDFLYKDTNWRRRTWGLYWLRQLDAIQADPKKRLAELDCGTQALAAMLVALGKPHGARAVKGLQPKTKSGFSLAELQNLATKQNVQLVGFQANPSQLDRLPMPLLLHYSGKTPVKTKNGVPYGHYVVVRSHDVKRHTWQVLNPQDGIVVSLSAKQIGKEWSGKGLMAAAPKAGVQLASEAKVPAVAAKPVRLSMAQMEGTRGTGYAVKGQDDIGCCTNNDGGGCGGNSGNTPSPNPTVAKAMGKSYGSPTISVNRVTQNIFITDTPLWYRPAKGPEVDITVSYNSQDASNYSAVTGNKWSFNYGSYIAEMPNRVIIYMPDGAQRAFTPSGTGTYISPRGFFSTLTKTATNTWTLEAQIGDKSLFGIPSGITTTIPVLLEQRDRWGQSLTFSYGVAGGRVVPFTVTDADGKVTRLQYDGAGHLIYAQTPDERQAGFTYDANGNMIQCVDAAGQAFQYSYDDMAIVTQLNTAQGAWNFTVESTPYGSGFRKYKTSIYDPSGSLPATYEYYTDDGYYHYGRYTSSDRRGNVTTYGVTSLYDANSGNTKAVISSISSQDGSYRYNGYDGSYYSRINDPTSQTIGSIETEITYNDQGLPTNTTFSDNDFYGKTRSTIVTYAPNGIDLVSANAIGADGTSTISNTLIQSITYNTTHQPLQSIDQNGQITNYTYKSWGAISTIETFEGYGDDVITHLTQYNYGSVSGNNNYNRVTSIYFDGNFQQGFTYDISGRVRTTTDVKGLTITYNYNNLDNILRVVFPDNTQESTEFTCCSLPGVRTDRSGRRSYFDYDSLKRLVRVQDCDGKTLQFSYDADGNRVEQLDSKGAATRWRYDSSNRIVKRIYANGISENYTYNNYKGVQSSTTNGRGQTTYFQYGAFYRPIKIDYPNSTDVNISYDLLGRLIEMDDDSGSTSWSYDSSGRVIKENGPWSDDSISYGYDSSGRVIGIEVERSPYSFDTISKSYDILGRLASISGNMGSFGNTGTFGYTYNGNSQQLLEMDRPNGLKTTYGYESSGSLQRLTGVSNTVSGYNVSEFNYSYSSGGTPSGFRDNRINQNKKYNNESVQTVSYGHNQTSMLTSENSTSGGTSTPAFSSEYQFDSMGNRTMVSDNINHTRVDAAYNPLNQLISENKFDTALTVPVPTGSQLFGYDDDGNMNQIVSKDSSGTITGTVIYGYDDASRLTSITSSSSKWEFVYDGFSRLRASIYSTGSPGSWTVQNEKRRVYNGRDVVQERDGNNNVTVSLLRNGNIGGILSRSTTSGHTYFGYDGGGNVTSLTNASGAVVGSYTYDGWGNLLSSSGTAGAENSYRFSTKESIAGLYYYGHRFYSSSLGRWINRDPIKEQGGVNLYAFVGNSPIDAVDEYGHELALAGWGALFGGVLSGLGTFASGASWCAVGMATIAGAAAGFILGLMAPASLVEGATVGGLQGALQTGLTGLFCDSHCKGGWQIALEALISGVVGAFFGGLMTIPGADNYEHVIANSITQFLIAQLTGYVGGVSNCPGTTPAWDSFSKRSS